MAVDPAENARRKFLEAMERFERLELTDAVMSDAFWTFLNITRNCFPDAKVTPYEEKRMFCIIYSSSTPFDNDDGAKELWLGCIVFVIRGPSGPYVEALPIPA